MVVNGENIRKIHKELLKITIKTPKMYLFMEKVSNFAKKKMDRRKTQDENAELLLLFFKKAEFNDQCKHMINHNLMEEAENQKREVIGDYIRNSRDLGKWIYLASSHTDCAEDHIPYQGRLYYDNKAPKEIREWAEDRGLFSIQWVMGAPAWFITRPNCRHFFKSLPLDVVKQYGIKELQRRYKTHRMTGDKKLATPRHIVVEEYRDRLKLLQAMYAQHPTEMLRREITKTKLLLKKHLNQL